MWIRDKLSTHRYVGVGAPLEPSHRVQQFPQLTGLINFINIQGRTAMGHHLFRSMIVSLSLLAPVGFDYSLLECLRRLVSAISRSAHWLVAIVAVLEPVQTLSTFENERCDSFNQDLPRDLSRMSMEVMCADRWNLPAPKFESSLHHLNSVASSLATAPISEMFVPKIHRKLTFEYWLANSAGPSTLIAKGSSEESVSGADYS